MDTIPIFDGAKFTAERPNTSRQETDMLARELGFNRD